MAFFFAFKRYYVKVRFFREGSQIIYKEDDYDKCLQTAELVSLKERRDQMCIQLIKSMSNSDHKLHIV